MALPEIAGWLMESLRVTFIAGGPVVGVNKNWWRILTGAEPETVTTRSAVAEHSESGPYGEGRLEMKVTFNRVDWMYTPVPVPGPTVPAIGAADEMLHALEGPIAQWLAAAETPFVRLAYGPTMLRKVDNIVEANKVAQAYLPFLQFDAAVARDVFNQINFPIQSAAVDGLTLNRVSKVMSAVAQVININVGQPVPKIETTTYSRVELDFSSQTDRSEPLSVENQTALLSEMIGQGRAFLEKGVAA